MESSLQARLVYYMTDFQLCPFDLGIGASGVSLLACARVASAWFQSTGTSSGVAGGEGAAFWSGIGARARWQSASPLFLELHFNAMFGTVSAQESADPGWVDAGALIGARL
jgi:hypothetical protein